MGFAHDLHARTDASDGIGSGSSGRTRGRSPLRSDAVLDRGTGHRDRRRARRRGSDGTAGSASRAGRPARSARRETRRAGDAAAAAGRPSGRARRTSCRRRDVYLAAGRIRGRRLGGTSVCAYFGSATTHSPGGKRLAELILDELERELGVRRTPGSAHGSRCCARRGCLRCRSSRACTAAGRSSANRTRGDRGARPVLRRRDAALRELGGQRRRARSASARPSSAPRMQRMDRALAARWERGLVARHGATMLRAVRFCLMLEGQAGRDLARLAAPPRRRAERLGFEATVPLRSLLQRRWAGDRGSTDAWTSSPALAAETSRIRLGTLCLRSRSVSRPCWRSARSTVDEISGGRVRSGWARAGGRRSIAATASRSHRPRNASRCSRSS